MQAVHGYYPAVYENGAGLYIPMPYGFKWHPAIAPATPGAAHTVSSGTPRCTRRSRPGLFSAGEIGFAQLFPCPGVAWFRCSTQG